jgi:hypothetical protein
MSKLKNLVLILAAIIMIGMVAACEKNNDSNGNNGNGTETDNIFINNPPNRGDVYIVGYEGRNAMVWKNGEFLGYATGTDISDTYKANSIFISGKDTYITGKRGNGGGILWKNGIPEVNSSGSDNYGLDARSVFVEGNDVYVAGGSSVWKNGVEQRLSSDYSSINVNSVYVFRGNIYVVGGGDREFNPYDGYPAYLWENGIKQTLYWGSQYSGGSAHSVFVFGGDIYVTGDIVDWCDYCEGSPYAYAVVWKNGIRQNLSNYASAQFVYVSGNDVYVAGIINNCATLWKNDVAQQLSNKESVANCVFVVGSDVYVVGHENYTSNRNRAVLWKNGVAQYLTDGAVDASAMSVFVVE